MNLNIEAQGNLFFHYKILVNTSKLSEGTLIKILDIKDKDVELLNKMTFEDFIKFLGSPSEPIELVGLGMPDLKEKIADLTIDRLAGRLSVDIVKHLINSQREAFRAGVEYSYERNRNEFLCNLYSLVDCPLIKNIRWNPSVLDKIKEFTERTELQKDCIGMISLDNLEKLFFELNKHE